MIRSASDESLRDTTPRGLFLEKSEDTEAASGKSPCLRTSDGYCFDESGSPLTTIDKIKLKLEEEEISFQLKKLELERQLSRARAKTQIEVEQRKSSVDEASFKGTDVVDSDVDVRKGVSVSRNISELSEVLMRLDLPKVELPTFDGEPTCYWSFIRQFQMHIESRVTDESQRLSYLLHYCRGRARRAIEGCIMLRASSGYQRARKILADLFGQPYVIVKAVMNDLTGGRPVRNTSSDLLDFSIRLQNCEMALGEACEQTDLNSAPCVEKLVRKLPPELQARWVEYASDLTDRGKEADFQDFRGFVGKRARIANSRYGQLLGYSTESVRATSSHALMTQNNQGPCSLCESPHDLNECSVFKNMTVADRWKHLTRNRRCFSCLNRGHASSKCVHAVRCGVDGCNAKHHKLLHNESLARGEKSKLGSDSEKSCYSVTYEPRVISLGVLPVRIVGPLGQRVTYALLDSGSDSTMVDARIARDIGLVGDSTKLQIHSVSSSHQIVSSRVNFSVESLDKTGTITVNGGLTMTNWAVRAGPPPKERLANWTHLKDVSVGELDDKHVGLLIGCDVPEAHRSLEEKVGSPKQPLARKTILGWIVLGPWTRSLNGDRSVLHSSLEVKDLLTRLYDSEFNDLEGGPAPSVEDRSAVDQVNNSIRLIDGHYEVGLPWRKCKEDLPNNKAMALRRLTQLKRKFLRQPELFSAYKDIIRRHVEYGYITGVPQHQLRPEYLPHWYIPHHAVLNPKKPGKVRVVYDCAARFQDLSLNEFLLQGPNLVSNLVDVLLRFRENKVALIADITEMFLQVRLPERERGAFRFLWWANDDINGPIAEMQLAVHPFGATSSPFCASVALMKSAELSDGNAQDIVRSALQNNFYVDDCLISVPTAVEGNKLASQLVTTLSKAGFCLNKWASNDPRSLVGLYHMKEGKTVIGMPVEGGLIERTLGLEWDTLTDSFRFSVSLPDRPPTRRGILSCVSSLYDPLGFVSPVLLPAKALLQGLCKRKLQWDEPIDGSDLRLWHEWLSSLKSLRDFSIPRCIKPEGECTSAPPELHLFSDASEIGYGVAVYLRFQLTDKSKHCSLVFAKSRVAPMKTISIPRLELTAATLSAKVAGMLRRSIGGGLKRTFFWTDSMTVLYYILNRTSRYSTFVANRIAIIHEHSEPGQWRFVRGELNPADYASRGLRANDAKFGIWFRGPEFLNSHDLEEAGKVEISVAPEACEFKKSVTALVTTTECALHGLLTKYSSWPRLIRAVAWLIRFKIYLMIVKGGRVGLSLNLGPIKVSEMRSALLSIVRMVQEESFTLELSTLRQGKHLGKGRLHKLNPELYDGVIIVGGRLQSSRLESCAKHPIVLPSHHAVTESIVSNCHRVEGHAGVQHVLGVIRKKFWILSPVATIKRVLNKCTTCRRMKGPMVGQMMAPLPESRVTPGMYPFESTGLDYFGPMYVKQGRSVVKRYACLFTCLKSRAVHLEVAQSMTTDSFLMTLMRFVNRRGTPKEIYSDNGTNFVGAEADLQRCLASLSQSVISNTLLEREVQWNFIPPAASHRGGVWERLVRSVKSVLRAVVTEQTPNDECLLTLFTEVERIINNRPLVPLCDDKEDRLALTPNDLLLLRPVDGLVLDECSNIGAFTRSWKQARHMACTFWKRWVRSYLPTLQVRSKWHKPARSIKVGDVVIVSNDGISRTRWPLGRVIEVHPGDDNLVRTANIKTSKGIIQRDVRKLCIIEGTDEYPQAGGCASLKA